MTSAPPSPSFVTAFGGVDRGDPAGKTWYQNLYAQSDFVFNGVYLSHGPTMPEPKNWLDQGNGYPAIKAQGWGWCLFFIGYRAQVKMNLPANLDTDEKVRAAGVTAGKHIKDYCYTLDPDLAGCVVIFDNEDAPQEQGGSLIFQKKNPDGTTTTDNRAVKYYTAIFEEMHRPGGDKVKKAPAIRAGFYSRPLQAPQMLAVVPDLFLWPCDPERYYRPPVYQKDLQTKKWVLQPPFNEVGDRIQFLNTWFKIKLVQVPGGRSSIPLGMQALIWDTEKKTEPLRYMPRKDLKGLKKVLNWDFDVSFVRDPRYPHGEPRFSVQGNKIVRGTFRKSDKSMGATATIFGGSTAQAPTMLGGDLLEPEAPLIFLPAGDIFSINQSGALVGSKPIQDGKWTGFAAISKSATPSASDSLRRMRALHVEPRGTDAYMFYISKQFQFVTKRRIGGRTAQWSDSAVMGPVSQNDGPHQLTNMAVTSTRQSIDVFFINSKDLLTTTSPLLSTSTAFPAQNSVVLERKPSLLLGTALAAISPTDNFILVFGITRQLNLSMAVWQSNNGWSALTPLGRAEDRVFAHSRLVAFCPARNRAVVYVGCVTDANVPCVYTIRAQNNQWTFSQRQEYPKTSGPVPKDWQDPNPNGPLGEAFSYDVNPFGDVGMFEDAQGVVFAITGANYTGGVVLVNHISSQGDWQRVK